MRNLTEALVCLSTPESTKVNGDPAKALLRTRICVWMEDSGTSPASTLPPARRTDQLSGALALLQVRGIGRSGAAQCAGTGHTGGRRFRHTDSQG